MIATAGSEMAEFRGGGNRRRFFAVAVALAGLALGGCGSAPKSTSPSSSTPTTMPAPPSTTAPTPTTVPTPTTLPAEKEPTTLGPGDNGPAVLALQQRLTSLGYWLGTPDGSFGDSTEQAVYALQKAAGISRDGIVGPVTEGALAQGVHPHPRSTSGYVIEVDLNDDLLMFVEDGKLEDGAQYVDRRWIPLHRRRGDRSRHHSHRALPRLSASGRDGHRLSRDSCGGPSSSTEALPSTVTRTCRPTRSPMAVCG